MDEPKWDRVESIDDMRRILGLDEGFLRKKLNFESSYKRRENEERRFVRYVIAPWLKKLSLKLKKKGAG